MPDRSEALVSGTELFVGDRLDISQEIGDDRRIEFDRSIAIRTRVRLGHLILLIPCWEGQEPISKRSEDPRKTSNAGKAESSKTLDLNPPNREFPSGTANAGTNGSSPATATATNVPSPRCSARAIVIGTGRGAREPLARVRYGTANAVMAPLRRARALPAHPLPPPPVGRLAVAECPATGPDSARRAKTPRGHW